MSDTNFKLSDATTLFSQQMSVINSLWTVYVVATFAAAGYGLSGITPIPATAVSFGFLIFALGNWSLISQSISLNQKLAADIVANLNAQNSVKFDTSLRFLAAKANPLWISRSAHILIDLCVLVLIWSHTGSKLA